ncbi:MAG: AAA family ATPase [Erysipelothrix sp.]|nr:AAA family ATPase [Erysipelothrix sp.]
MKTPLAHKLRPTLLDDIIGQEHLTGPGQIIRKMVTEDALLSMILFGNPGTGKTTLATVIAQELKRPYRMFNAVIGSKKDLNAIFEEGKLSNGLIVIVEEIHRLNKDKQDLLLPHLEDGTITIIGTTTSNPYFAINPAIRSRLHLFEVKPIDQDSLFVALRNIMSREMFKDVSITDDAITLIVQHSNGDMRTAINLVELCILSTNEIDHHTVSSLSKQPSLDMDSDGDGHYDVLSGLQKSIRGSDVNAALYYLAKLILAGDLQSIERRLVAIAYEDVGLGNPAAVARTIEAVTASNQLGLPEAKLPLSMAVVDLALSPKSRSACDALDEAIQYVTHNPHQMPDYLRYTPVNMDEEDKYPYDRPDLWMSIQYLPEPIKNKKFLTLKGSSAYEVQLAKNYTKLNSLKRSSKIRQLKSNPKKP